MSDALQQLDQDIARGIVEAGLGVDAEAPAIKVTDLGPAPYRYRFHDGEKFPGGFGPTQLLLADYWTLRARSSELFETNLYARGLVRRLVTNEINTGLHLEAVPDEAILGFQEDALAGWAELVENRFRLWEKSGRLCDQRERGTFGALQAQARMEALIAGDVLVVLRQDRRTQLPRIQLVSGSAVQTPLDARPHLGNRIEHGVELDSLDRHVAFWVRQRDGRSKRLPAFGEKSGRRIAWLVYGTDKRLDDVRGKPILSLFLQSLKEIDRYRDSTQRKATINSMLAMFIKKTHDKPGTLPLTGGAVRRGTAVVDAGDGTEREFRVMDHHPGLVIEELQQGEEPQAFGAQGTDERFGEFEEAIVQTIAWANEIPPEILRLAFSNNYSASQAAINEFKIYLNKVRTGFGEEFCHPIYEEWLVSEVLAQKVDAPGLLEARRNPTRYDVYGAWVGGDWSGHIKPSTDIFKQARGYKMLVDEGWITRDRAARELTGTKYSKNAKKLRRENEALVAALEPIKSAESAVAELDRADREEREDERAAG